MNTQTVECISVSKKFGSLSAVQDLNLSLAQGEILAIVGPSGCGKTTLLRLIAGFESLDSGAIYLNGRLTAGPHYFIPPERRGVGLVFQEHALFPHLSVMDNITFGLQGRPASEKRMVAAGMLELTGLAGYEGRYPHELSGGERQRVALARALAPQPLLLLMDEPFSSLDADLRGQMREEVRRILESSRATAIFVTHDQEEAMILGDRLAVINQGRLEQIGSPEQVFHAPDNRFVAEFMGHTDLLPGVVTSNGILTEIGFLPQRVRLPEGTEVDVAVRFDDLSIDPRNGLSLKVEAKLFKGAQNRYRVRLPSGGSLHVELPHTVMIDPGSSLQISLQPGHPLACFHGDRAAQILDSQFADPENQSTLERVN